MAANGLSRRVLVTARLQPRVLFGTAGTPGTGPSCPLLVGPYVHPHVHPYVHLPPETQLLSSAAWTSLSFTMAPFARTSRVPRVLRMPAASSGGLRGRTAESACLGGCLLGMYCIFFFLRFFYSLKHKDRAGS